MFGVKIGTSYFVPKIYKAIENFENKYGEQGTTLLNKLRQVVYPQLDNLSQQRNYQDSEFDKIVLFLFNNHKQIIDDFQQLSQKQISNKETNISEKQDACYNKVKSRYKVWPSAYASGALVQCRKKGAANWGNKSTK
jgi:hypothetical protein